MRRMPACHPTKRHAGNGKCHGCYYKEWRQRNPGKVKASQERYNKTHAAKRKEYARAYRLAHPEDRRRHYLANLEKTKKAIKVWYDTKGIWKRRAQTYGVSKERWLSMYENQHGLCAICARPIAVQRASTDHNHATGKVRALLCVTCNAMLGQAKEDPKTLLRGADYLYEHSA